MNEINLTWQEISKLPIDEFDKIARNQSTLFPDMLLFQSEEETIDMYYEAHKRKRM